MSEELARALIRDDGVSGDLIATEGAYRLDLSRITARVEEADW